MAALQSAGRPHPWTVFNSHRETFLQQRRLLLSQDTNSKGGQMGEIQKKRVENKTRDKSKGSGGEERERERDINKVRRECERSTE